MFILVLYPKKNKKTKRKIRTLQSKPSTSNSKIKKILAHNDFKPNTRNNKNIHKEIDNLLHEIPKQMH